MSVSMKINVYCALMFIVSHAVSMDPFQNMTDHCPSTSSNLENEILDKDTSCMRSPTIGAATMGSVLNIADVNNLTGSDKALISAMLLQHGVIVIPNQNMSRQQQVDFSAQFGSIVNLPPSFEGNDPQPGFPEIHRVTNYWANGTWKGKTHCFGCYWHKDGNFQQNGYIISLLFADQVSEHVSKTNFFDNCEVYNRLADKTKDTLSKVKFSISIRDIPDFKRATEQDLNLYPLAKLHKGVYRHPGNRRKCAYMHTALTTSDDTTVDLTDLQDAWEDLITKSTKYAHTWNQGDIVMWDNLAVFHRAGASGADKQKSSEGNNDRSRTPRMLYRTQYFLNNDDLSI